ncbi:MAG: hypothetical protein MRJ67_15595 [Nitrospirales bacterium]|nr:hypothetical protein [Nitrospirales bacterium]
MVYGPVLGGIEVHIRAVGQQVRNILDRLHGSPIAASAAGTAFFFVAAIILCFSLVPCTTPGLDDNRRGGINRIGRPFAFEQAVDVQDKIRPIERSGRRIVARRV